MPGKIKTMAKPKYDCIAALQKAGISANDARALRRISMTLNRWFEMECGSDQGAIERDDRTGKPYRTWDAGQNGKRNRRLIPDREKGAKARLGHIMTAYPALRFFIQGDPRGAALYILRPGDIPEGAKADECYSRGVAVY